MKSVMRVFVRFVAATAAISLLLLFVNFAFISLWAYNSKNSIHTTSVLSVMADGLTLQDDGYQMSPDADALFRENYQWAMLISDGDTSPGSTGLTNTANDGAGTVVWSKNLPPEIPRTYTHTQIAKFTRWFLEDYPVYVWEHPDGLLVFGDIKDSFAKFPVETTMKTLHHLPRWLIGACALNMLFALLLAFLLGLWLVRTFRPLVKGIHGLAEDEDVCLSTKGLLGDLADRINMTSAELKEQRDALRTRDAARSSWISGVSHDIRTPLSMVLGYASQLEENGELPEDTRRQANIIRHQGLRMKQLVNDLNLASKLEYEMQPLFLTQLHPVELVRTIVTDFLNGSLLNDSDTPYAIEFKSEPDAERLLISADGMLLRRAISNLIQNSIKHNPQGCTIYASVKSVAEFCIIEIADDGKGISPSRLEKLRTRPHYMVADQGSGDQLHGLGLLLVQQIARVHGGHARLNGSRDNGFRVQLQLPLIPLTPDAPCESPQDEHSVDF